MACPTCDHTMQLVCRKDSFESFWCPRCGTLIPDAVMNAQVPKLIERVRRLREFSTDELKGSMSLAGITEAILTPNQR